MIERNKDDMAVLRAPRGIGVRNCFNPAMLTAAREARFLSQTELARELGMSQSLVARWEAGLGKVPDDEQISALSAKLDVQPEWFFVDHPRRLASMSDFYHRALSRAKRKDVKAIHARCSIIDVQIDRLLRSAESIPDDAIPFIDPREYKNDVEEVARMARGVMGIEPGPIANLVEAIERSGAIVIDRLLEVDDIDALCRWVPELPKLFFLHGARPADRIRFSLAHELGHTVMHFGRDCDQKTAEDQANAFAAAFLMPAKEIRPDFANGVRITDLAAIKRKWRISMQAAARRAFTIGVIDGRRYKTLCIQMSRNGWRKTEPVRIEGESPKTFIRLIKDHLELGFTRKEMAKLLLVSDQMVDRMLSDADSPNYQDHGVRLRLIREDD